MRALLHCLFLGCIFLTSCEEAFFDDDQPDDPVANFEFLWDTFDERYTLFEFKEINWDEFYSEYRPQVSDLTTDDELFVIMAEMLNRLRDGHTNLRSPIDISRYRPYLQAPPNFDAELLERSYLQDARLTGYLTNEIMGEVGYIHYRSFQLPIQDWELDTVINRFTRENVQGVIIDVRNNGGGNPANGLKLLSRMIDERTHIYTSQQRNGPASDDLAASQDIFLDPESDHPHFPGQVVVLSNRKVYSAGSYFCAGTKGISQVVMVGDTTGGGSGVPAGFELPNGWYCNYSSTLGTLVTGENFESGVPPDVEVALSAEDRERGVDTILEAAIALIKM